MEGDTGHRGEKMGLAGCLCDGKGSKIETSKQWQGIEGTQPSGSWYLPAFRSLRFLSTDRMTRRFPTTSRAVVTIITVNSVGATQVARGDPGGPAPADSDQVERIASPPASQQLAVELFSGISG